MQPSRYVYIMGALGPIVRQGLLSGNSIGYREMNMRILAWIIAAVMLAASTAQALESDLDFDQGVNLPAVVKRLKKDSHSVQAGAKSTPVQARVQGSFVPPQCRVETWCLVKATECFLGHYSHRPGWWIGHAQYSVVRKAVVSCPSRYGEWVRQTMTGPVEPVTFRSQEETTQENAEEQAMNRCRGYRQDWVSAAPTCGQ